MININIKTLATIFSMYQRGDIVCAHKSTDRIKEGEKGVVVYAKHENDGPSTYIIIFEYGGVMHINSQKTSLYIVSLQTMAESVKDYNFTNVLNLIQDYLSGHFREAFNQKLLLLKFG